MKTMNGVDLETRERVWTDDADANRAFIHGVKQTAAGRKYFNDFGSTENNEIVVAAVWQLYPSIEFVTVSAFVDTIKTLMAAGELTPLRIAPPTPPPAAVPTDKNGRPLTEAQIKWSEYTKFANEHSMRDINERKRTDRGFADFVRTSLIREMTQTIDGDVRPYNPHMQQITPSKSALANKTLMEFAAAYRQTPVAEIRSARRFDVNPLTAQKFIDTLEECIRQGLI